MISPQKTLKCAQNLNEQDAKNYAQLCAALGDIHVQQLGLKYEEQQIIQAINDIYAKQTDKDKNSA